MKEMCMLIVHLSVNVVDIRGDLLFGVNWESRIEIRLRMKTVPFSLYPLNLSSVTIQLLSYQSQSLLYSLAL